MPGVNGEEQLKAAEWAAWVLMGDPFAKVPVTLQPIADRIAQAVSQARIPLRAEIDQLKHGNPEVCYWDVPIDTLTCPKHGGSIRDCPQPSGTAGCYTAGGNSKGE